MNELNLSAYCKEAGVSFYDSELVSENGHKIYRVYIIKEGGVSLDDCARLSEILSPVFDVKPPCEGEYFLEVSSPGLERKLSKIEHFSLSIGENVKIVTDEKEKFEAKIIGVKDENIILELQNTPQNSDKNTLELPFNKIKKAKTFVQW
ncbi:ribosome maturation factor [Campylobacter sp. MIT 99-7217]|uniref:ribosome maturation factor RimP n=1 Tax=Campylobacter sp. MIT 99-7217 TaxID=535091 RepID=UPI00115BB836|nr:ribosome maturation factor RimP [Campylobacter sp. MIT 99-7217]TQR31289.1 ribosome maturation factor [Campylobacter sp. MIT 99-7217]